MINNTLLNTSESWMIFFLMSCKCLFVMKIASQIPSQRNSARGTTSNSKSATWCKQQRLTLSPLDCQKTDAILSTTEFNQVKINYLKKNQIRLRFDMHNIWESDNACNERIDRTLKMMSDAPTKGGKLRYVITHNVSIRRLNILFIAGYAH